MRQRPFPPAHGGGNLCGKTWPRSPTATPRTQRKYAQSVWANRTSVLLGELYVDWCPEVSAHRYQHCRDSCRPVSRMRSQSTYSEIIPIVPSHVSTNCGHPVIGNFVRRSPNACPPCAYKCISTGTPAFFSAMW